MNVPAPASNLAALIDRMLKSDVDLDKADRIIEMQRDWEMREAERIFAQSLTAAEAEMETVRADASNPQTRSRYAKFASLDAAIRPIYTKHGFAISFTTEATNVPDSIMVVGTLSHALGCTRRTQIPVPIVTRGFKGQEMMTPIHATMSAISYGKRHIEVMMFNLQVGDVDDDGNRAGQRRPQGLTGYRNGEPETVNPATGEVSVEPMNLALARGEDYRSWGERLMRRIRRANNIDEIDQWILLNQDFLLMMREEKPALFQTLQSAIDTEKEKVLKQAEGTEGDAGEKELSNGP